MAKISSVKAREILDSRGNPTVEVCIICILYVLCGIRALRVCVYAHNICFNSQTIVFISSTYHNATRYKNTTSIHNYIDIII